VLLGDELPEDELLPLEGDVADPGPPDGLVAELLPDEDGERGVAVDPLLGGLLEPLLFEPELSQATSEAAERKAAAISHLFSIRSSPLWLSLSRAPASGATGHDASLCVSVTSITERQGKNSVPDFPHTGKSHRF
jgi:hypothetical protein